MLTPYEVSLLSGNLTAFMSCLTSRVEDVFDGVDIIQAKRLEASLEWAKASPLPPAKQLPEEPREGRSSPRDEAKYGKEGEGVNHGWAALVIIGCD